MEISKTLSKSPVFIILTFIFSTIAYPRSVYVITDHEDSDISAYKINGDQVDYQAQMDPPLDFGSGAVGLALDPCSCTLFTSYDGTPHKIGIIDAKTLKTEKSIDTPVEFAGLSFDAEKQRLLAAQRQANALYTFLWDPITKSLSQKGNPKNLQFLGGFGAYGLALDETDRILYVTNRTNEVKYYDSNDPNFGYLGSIDITVDSNAREAVGIDFYNDGQGNKYLYTGAWSHSTRHNCLVRTDINDVNNPSSTERPIGASATSVAADQATGYIYITTSNNHIEVYNNSTFPSDPCDTETNGIDGPADIIVRGDVSYKPPLLVLTKDDNDVSCVVPGDYITYTISYDANGHSVKNVEIIDYLPDEVDFNSASGPNRVYDSDSHTVTWGIGSLSPTDSNSVTLNVRIDPNAPLPLETIINFCEAESDSTYNAVYCLTPDVIYVDADANDGNDTGKSWRNAYLELQDALQAVQTYNSSQIWVAEGIYKRTTDPDDSKATFELVDGVGLYGGFAGNEISRSWRNWMGNETILSGDIDNNGTADVDHVVTASGVGETAIIDGFTIKKGSLSGIEIIGGSPTISHNRITNNVLGPGIWCQDTETPLITNNWIHHNSGGGIYFSVAVVVATVRNNTVVYNTNFGISRPFGFEPKPNITNCILWANTDDLSGGCYATYSCIQNDDPCEGNITGDANNPQFVDANSNDFHLESNSPCIDAGDPCFVPDDPNEKDIDGQRRVSDGDANGTYIVDMGADEYNRIPQDPHKFYIKNSSDETVAWFGNLGNLVLKGTFTSGEICTSPPDSNLFIIANSTDGTVAYIDNEGNLRFEGDWWESCANCNPTTDAFIIRDSSDANVGYIDFEYGDLCLTGRLYPNSNP